MSDYVLVRHWVEFDSGREGFGESRRGKKPGQALRLIPRDVLQRYERATKPLEVVWLCRPCHVAEHNARRKGTR
jgi:hypothetical protein